MDCKSDIIFQLHLYFVSGYHCSISRKLIAPAFYVLMHIIIISRREFVLVFCQTLDFSLHLSLFHQKLYGMSFLSAVSGSPGVYILEKPDDLAISEQ